MSNQIKKPTPKIYDAGDMLDLSDLAVNDVKWLGMGITNLKEKFIKLKENTQSVYKVDDCYFDEMAEFFGMYEYLADDRLREQERLAEKYKKEFELVKGGKHDSTS